MDYRNTSIFLGSIVLIVAIVLALLRFTCVGTPGLNRRAEIAAVRYMAIVYERMIAVERSLNSFKEQHGAYPTTWDAWIAADPSAKAFMLPLSDDYGPPIFRVDLLNEPGRHVIMIGPGFQHPCNERSFPEPAIIMDGELGRDDVDIPGSPDE